MSEEVQPTSSKAELESVLRQVHAHLDPGSSVSRLVPADMAESLRAIVAVVSAEEEGVSYPPSMSQAVLLTATKVEKLLSLLAKDSGYRMATLEAIESLNRELARLQRSGSTAPASERQTPFLELARHYGEDAKAARRGAHFCAAGAGLSAASAVALIVLCSLLLSTGPTHPRILATLGAVACVGLIVIALVLLHAMNARNRVSREYVRLQRGVEGIEDWLAPLPRDARDLLRMTVTQSLFPRLLDDDDPSHRSVWPSDNAMLQSIYGVPPEVIARFYEAQSPGVEQSPPT